MRSGGATQVAGAAVSGKRQDARGRDMAMTTYMVTGMTCEHCVRAVTQELTRLGGVRAVTVDLAPGGQSRVTVASDAPVTDQAVAAALDEAGEYRMVAT
jgi:copper chaperone